MTLYGRDNIVNAIWNDKTDSTDNVFLKNITYEVVNGAGQLENKTFYENEQGTGNMLNHCYIKYLMKRVKLLFLGPKI